MDLEKEEMHCTDEMKELLWIKSLNEEEYKQLIRDEFDTRIKTLKKPDKVWGKMIDDLIIINYICQIVDNRGIFYRIYYFI